VVRQLVRDSLPIPPVCIISARDYDIGEWYPFRREGKISDAKTLTACGVALFNYLNAGHDPAFSIIREISPEYSRRNYWKRISTSHAPDSTILEPDQDTVEIEIFQIGEKIGRSMLADARSECIYIVEWKGDETLRPQTFKITLERVVPEDPLHAESLQIIATSGTRKDGTSVMIEDVALRLYTLGTDHFWMDRPSFEVRKD
jgi:hypothetical protein